MLREAGLDLRFDANGLRGHAAKVDAAAITEDGTMAATSSARDGTVSIWDVASGEEIAKHSRPRGSAGEARAMAVHPSGRILTIAGADGSVERIDTATGQMLWRHVIDAEGFMTCALSKSGAGLACAQGTKLEVFDTVTGARLSSLDDPSFRDPTDYKIELRAYVFDFDDDDGSGPSPRQTRIKDIVVTDDGRATPLFERPIEKTLAYVPPMRAWPTMIAHGASAIAVGYFDGSVTVWSEDGELLRSLGAPPKPGNREVLSVAMSKDDDIAVGRSDRSIEVFGARGGEPRVVVESGTRSIIGIRALAWSPDGTLLIGLGDDGVGRWWRKDGTKGTFAENDGAGCLAIAFQPSGAFFATSSCTNHVRIWRTKNPIELQQFHERERPAALAYSPSGEVLAVGAEDILRSLPIGRTIARVPAGAIESVITLGSTTLLTAARDGMIARWALDVIEPHGSFTQALREVLVRQA